MNNLKQSAVLGFLLSLPALGFITANTFKSQPHGYIPMWSDQVGGTEVLLVNTNNIVTIKPVFEDEKRLNTTHLIVTLNDGDAIEVFEDYEEFKGRIKAALK